MARGIATKSDILVLRDGTDPNQIWNEFQATVETANAQRSALIELLTFKTTDKADTVLQAPGGTDEFELASEMGVPKAIRDGGTALDLGYPLDWFDAATRYTWRYLIDASTSQIEALHNAALAADNRLQFRTVLNALFGNTNRTHASTDATIYALYNGDGTVPPKFNGNTFTGTHTHYLTTESTTLTSPSDVEDLVNTVLHHGFGDNDGAKIVLLCNRQEADIIAGWRAGVGGAKFDFISSDASVPYLTTEMLVGERPGGEFNGMEISGQYGHALIAPTSLVPAGYMAAVAVGSTTPVLGLREHPRKPGLQLIKGRDVDYPLVESYYAHGIGAGVRQRGAAAVMQVTASTTYTPPTF